MSDPNIYEQLNTFTLSNVSAEDIMNITDKTHLQFQNEFDLERYNLINQATNRTGLPMPNEGTVRTYTQTSDSDAQVVQPPKGEVWEIMNISVANSPNVTGTNDYYMYFTTDATNATPGAQNDSWISILNNNSGNVISSEDLFREKFTPLFVTNTMFLKLWSDMDNVGTSAVVKWIVAYIRRY